VSAKVHAKYPPQLWLAAREIDAINIDPDAENTTSARPTHGPALARKNVGIQTNSPITKARKYIFRFIY
jgi:hypothetical protein